MSLNSHSHHPATVRRKPTQARSERTVARILDAAAHVFAELGYTATTTNHVAKAAGVSIGSLYQYFPNKDALLVALEERHLDDAMVVLRQAADRWRRAKPTPRAWADDLVDVLVAVNDSPLHVLTYDTAPPLPHVRRLTESLIEELTGEVAHHLRRWGLRRQSDVRAQVVVVATLRLVHDLAIRTPPGGQRDHVHREITRLVALVAQPASAVK